MSDVFERLWDDGNAVGLDGWTGPGRGAGEVDREAERARDRAAGKAWGWLAEHDREVKVQALREAVAELEELNPHPWDRNLMVIETLRCRADRIEKGVDDG